MPGQDQTVKSRCIYLAYRCFSGYDRRDKGKTNLIPEEKALEEWEEFLVKRFPQPASGGLPFVLKIIKVVKEKRTEEGLGLSEKQRQIEALRAAPTPQDGASAAASRTTWSPKPVGGAEQKYKQAMAALLARDDYLGAAALQAQRGNAEGAAAGQSREPKEASLPCSIARPCRAASWGRRADSGVAASEPTPGEDLTKEIHPANVTFN